MSDASTGSENMCRYAMRKVMSIDDIAQMCKKDDVHFAISVDAPLVTALNARNPRNLFGFAFTPMQVADSCATDIIRASPDTDLEVSRKIMHITGHTLRFTHSTVKKIREVRRYTDDVQAYLSRREKEVYEAFLQTQPLDNVMNRVTDEDLARFYNNRETAVIDIDFFTSLDKMMAPRSHETYIYNSTLEDSPEEDYFIDRIYSIGNDRQIAECVVDLVTKENCNDVAIVLDAGGSIAEAVRSALYRKDIPFKNNMEVKDLASIRDFIRFVGTALEYKTVRVGDVRELFSSYGAKGNGLSTRADGFLLCKFNNDYLKKPDTEEDATTARLRDLMERISNEEVTFDEVVSDLPRNDVKSSIKILLRDMNIGGCVVDKSHVTDLEYAVNNIDDLKHNEQIPDDERRGVLLADCRTSTYIDRAVVFFIGLDDAWHNSPSGKDYIRDPQGFEEKEAMRLRILLQQGDRRFYIVRPATGGKPTSPCPTFETIAEIEGRPRHIESFKDICDEVISGSWHEENTNSALPSTVSDRDAIVSHRMVFDKTSYNNWKACPYRFAFKMLLRNDYEENSNALFGSFVHEFAEFSFCFPELARERFDEYVDILLSKYSGISNTCMAEIDASKFRTIMRNVMAYTASIRPADLVLDMDNLDRKYPNFLISEDPRTGNRCSSLAERKTPSTEGHAFYSKPDLVIGCDVIDYKTGAAKKYKDISDAFTDKKSQLPEYQPLIYLKTRQEELGGDCTVRFNLVYFGNHVAETVRDADGGEPDMSKSIRVVEATVLDDPAFMIENRVLDSIYDDICEKSSYSKFVDKWDSVCNVLLALAETPGWVKSESTLEAMVNQTGLKDKSKMKTFLNKVYDLMGDVRTYDDKIVISDHFLKRFTVEIDEEAVRAERFMELPVFSNIGRESVNCKYCDYKSVCMSTMAKDYEGGEEE